jgi:hypothetical protein
VFAEIVEREVIKELRPAMTSRDFIRFAVGGPSTVASFPLWSSPGVAAAPADDITDIASTVMADTEQSATAAEVGFRIDVSDVIKATSPSNLIAEASGQVARSVAEKWETDLAALMDDFSNVTTAASTLTGLDVLAAVSALETRDIPGPYVGYFDPKQTGELRAEIATTTASYAIGRDGEKVMPFGDSGFFGTYMGLPIWQTSLVVTTTGLVGGAVFASKVALGCYEIWGPRIETQRDASLRALEIVGTQCYGFKELSDTRGQTVKSAA